MADSYRVVVTRENDTWVAELPDLDGSSTFARTLPKLDTSVRETVVLMAGLPDQAMAEIELTWDYRTGIAEIDELAPHVRRLRQQARQAETEANHRTTHPGPPTDHPRLRCPRHRHTAGHLPPTGLPTHQLTTAPNDKTSVSVPVR